MTFWEDFKNWMESWLGVLSFIRTYTRIGERVLHPENYENMSDSEYLKELNNESVKDKSVDCGLFPNLLGAPIFNTVYSAGFGKEVERRVNSVCLQSLLNPQDYVVHKRRFNNPEVNYQFYLKELGYDNIQQQIISDLDTYYPSPVDFIRFGVREVFNPTIVSKYRYDADYPDQIDIHAQKAGISPDVMRWYWRAHWELPSYYNIREARWRDYIDDNTLDEFLKTADYPEYWRDILKKIIYTPYTRVDVRRLYQTGVITRDEVYRNYLDIGYDPEHAEKLTQFTVLDADKTKEMLSTFVNAYKQDIITESELKEKLLELGYSEQEVDLRIQLLNNQSVVHQRRRDLTRSQIEKLFKKGFITSEELEERLINLGYSEDDVGLMKMLIISETENYKVWVSEIKKAYKLDLLDHDEAFSKLRDCGYTDEAITLSLAIIDLKKGEVE